MNNLISNAFKFTPEYGKISISVWREADRLLIDVSDTGEDMDETVVEYVFEPFYQADGDKRSVGSGVGLALVKQIIDALEGEITVDSMVGKGSTFHVNLPIHNNCKHTVVNENEENNPLLPTVEPMLIDSNTTENDCRILIIEDNKEVAAYIGSQLSDSYSVAYAINGKEGMERALELVPDLIITDLMMPVMDGYEVCRQIRDNEIINHIPIIIITAKITEKERIKGLEAGADAYLTKPFNSDELRTRVEHLLSGRQLLREKFASTIIEQKADKDNNEPSQSDSDKRFLSKVSDAIYLQLSLGKDVYVSIIASNLCMSNSQLYRKMSALTGYTPIGYIQRVKIRKAKNLLDSDQQMAFSEIADKSGFNDYSTFVRAFKNVYGITPSDYRKNIERSI